MSEARELLERVAAVARKHSVEMGEGVASMHSVLAADIGIALAHQPEPGAVPRTFQDRVHDWMLECFGSEITDDTTERNRRFLEEALELVQANGCTAADAHWLVDYVFARPVGELRQEVGGVMVTLAALCNAAKDGSCVDECAEAELTRVWGKIAKIREKQAAKPKPGAVPELPLSVTESKSGKISITLSGNRVIWFDAEDADDVLNACRILAARERARRAGS